MYQTAIQDAVKWLLRNQTSTGDFHYEYDPLTGQYSTLDNLTRQAGTAFILSEVYLFDAQPEILSAIEKSLDFLQSACVFENQDGQQIAYVMDGKVAKVNLPAFVVMIYSNIKDPKFRQKYQKLYQANLPLLHTQQNPAGGFQKFIRPLTRQKRSSFADGECFLALTYLYRENPTPELLENIHFHYKFFDQHYRLLLKAADQTEKTKKYIRGFYLWAMRAIHTLPIAEISTEMLDFAALFTEYIILTYQPDQQKIDNHGALIEGMVPVNNLSKKFPLNLPQLNLAVKKSLSNMLLFQINQQTIDSISKIIDLPIQQLQASEGGFLTSLTPANFKLRVDFTQHCLGALLLASR